MLGRNTGGDKMTKPIQQASQRIKAMWEILRKRNPLVDEDVLLPFAIMDYLDEQSPEFKDKVKAFYCGD